MESYNSSHSDCGYCQALFTQYGLYKKALCYLYNLMGHYISITSFFFNETKKNKLMVFLLVFLENAYVGPRGTLNNKYDITN